MTSILNRSFEPKSQIKRANKPELSLKTEAYIGPNHLLYCDFRLGIHGHQS